jgi:hypothetical protein
MLQTDLHNPQVKKHMTMEEFVRNNRGIDNNKDLPRDMLEEVYCNIRDKKVRRCHVSGGFVCCVPALHHCCVNGWWGDEGGCGVKRVGRDKVTCGACVCVTSPSG